MLDEKIWDRACMLEAGCCFNEAYEVLTHVRDFLKPHIRHGPKLRPKEISLGNKECYLCLVSECTRRDAILDPRAKDMYCPEPDRFTAMQVISLTGCMRTEKWDSPEEVCRKQVCKAVFHDLLVQVGGRDSSSGVTDFRNDIFEVSDSDSRSVAANLAREGAGSKVFRYKITSEYEKLEFSLTVDDIKQARAILGKAMDDYIVLFAIRRMSFFRRAWKAPAEAVAGRCPARLLNDEVGMNIARLLLELLRAEKKSVVASVDASDSGGSDKAFVLMAEILRER